MQSFTKYCDVIILYDEQEDISRLSYRSVRIIPFWSWNFTFRWYVKILGMLQKMDSRVGRLFAWPSCTPRYVGKEEKQKQ